jgi:endonuclease G
MKHLLIIILSVITISSYSQHDTTINNGVYMVVYSIDYKVPKVVKYHLYHGGGECSRDRMSFKSQSFTSNDKEYTHSGYDRGHMVNAEDYAFDCIKMKKTFEFYNVVPQTHHFNAGIFKRNEEEIRKLSQTDSIEITIINIIDKKNYIGTGTHKILTTYKMVKSLTTNKILLCVKLTELTDKIEFVTPKDFTITFLCN